MQLRAKHAVGPWQAYHRLWARGRLFHSALGAAIRPPISAPRSVVRRSVPANADALVRGIPSGFDSSNAAAASRGAAALAIALSVAFMPGPHKTGRDTFTGACPNCGLVYEIERGGFDTLRDMCVLSSSDIWGTTMASIVHYDGASWRVVAADQGVEWRAIDARGGAGWVVGTACSVRRLDHGLGPAYSLGCDAVFEDVSMAPSGQAWAGGHKEADGRKVPVLYNYDGARWLEVPVRDGGAIRAVKAFANGQVWIVDDVGVLVLDRGNWRRELFSRDLAPLYDVDGAAPDDVWVVGGAARRFGGPTEIILHFDGSRWVVAYHGSSHSDYLLRRVSIVSATEGWAVGEWGIVERFDGREWLKVALLGIDPYGLAAIGRVGVDDVWFGGNAGQLAHWQAGAVTFTGGLRQNGANEPIRSISLLPGRTGWAAGRLGPLLARQERRWFELDNATYYDRLYTDHPSATVVEAVSSSEAWAATTVPATLRHFTDGEWRDEVVPTSFPVVGISAVSRENVWAIASTYEGSRRVGGDIIHYDGESWQLQFQDPGIVLWSIDMIDTREGWAVGNKVLHYSEGDWHVQDVSGTLSAVSFASADVGYALGWSGDATILLEYRDKVWHSVDLVVEKSEFIRAIAAAPDGSVWMVSSAGRLWHGDSEGFMTVAIDAARYDYGAICTVGTADDYSVWFGGYFDSIGRIDVRATSDDKPTPRDVHAHKVFVPIARTQ